MKIHISSFILPSHFRSALPALVAMFALGSTFQILNFALFQNMIKMEWDNTFVTITYNICFAFCILGLIGLFIRPAIALKKNVMFFVVTLSILAAVFLFQNTDHKLAWFLFFVVQGGTSVFWHQNVRLTLIALASKGEYARIFSLYMISHISGNIFGGFLFKSLDGNMQILSALLICYMIGAISLLFYPKCSETDTTKKREKNTFQHFITLVRSNPFIWLVALASGFVGETFFNFFVPYLNQNGATAALALWALLAFQIGGVLSKYPVAVMMDKIGLLRAAGWLIAASIFSTILLIDYTGTTLFVTIALALFLGGTLNTLTIVGDTAITTITPKKDHQKATTLSIILFFLGGLLGNSLVGPAMDQIGSISLPIITIAFIILMAIGLKKSGLLIKRDPPLEPNPAIIEQ